MKQLLLIEDDLSLINGLSFALKKQGYGLDTARTVKEGRQLWKEKHYDLIILDIMEIHQLKFARFIQSQRERQMKIV